MPGVPYFDRDFGHRPSIDCGVERRAQRANLHAHEVGLIRQCVQVLAMRASYSLVKRCGRAVFGGYAWFGSGVATTVILAPANVSMDISRLRPDSQSTPIRRRIPLR